MALIQWLRYPTDVNQSVKTIPVQVQLPAGMLITNLTLNATWTTPNVSLYQENGALFFRTISAPLLQYEVYLTLTTIDDHDVWVQGLIDPKAAQAIAVTLQD